MLTALWTDQLRFLEYERIVHPEAQPVRTSLPQGDSWSVVAMVMALTPATNSIKAAFPNSVIRTFIDDRTVVSPTAAEAVQICHEWSRWSHIRGLQENLDKATLWHSTAEGQRQLRSQGVEPAPNPKILGVQLQGAKKRRNTEQENDRISSCLRLLQRSRYLPIAWAAKHRVIVGAVFGKLTWGWMFHVPPKTTLAKIQSAVNRALGELQGACPHLRSILRGHSLDVAFRLLQTNVSAAMAPGEAGHTTLPVVRKRMARHHS